MPHAPHTNQDHVRDPFNYPIVLGCFKEKDHGTFFEFAGRGDINSKWADDFAPIDDYPHMIYVEGVHERGYRYAHVLKTVAYVVVDEADDGQPIVEKWDIKQCRRYDVEWVDDKFAEIERIMEK